MDEGIDSRMSGWALCWRWVLLYGVVILGLAVLDIIP